MTPPPSAPAACAPKRKIIRRERFLAEMEQVVPWVALLGALAPHYFPGAKDKARDPEMH